jgi:hypothetical protein
MKKVKFTKHDMKKLLRNVVIIAAIVIAALWATGNLFKKSEGFDDDNDAWDDCYDSCSDKCEFDTKTSCVKSSDCVWDDDGEYCDDVKDTDGNSICIENCLNPGSKVAAPAPALAPATDNVLCEDKCCTAQLDCEINKCGDLDGEEASDCSAKCDRDLENCHKTIPSAEYRGYANMTVSDRECQNWTSQKPHKHQVTPETFTNYSEKGVGNHKYCRDPDKTGVIWCYTTDENKRWEKCNP